MSKIGIKIQCKKIYKLFVCINEMDEKDTLLICGSRSESVNRISEISTWICKSSSENFLSD